jgi:hypothetical protein
MKNDSLKFMTETHKFRGERDPKKDISPERFKLSQYLSKAETIAKAIKDAQIFER